MNSIWSSVEADAWSRGFDYEDYLHLHKQSCLEARVVSEKAYYRLCAALDMNMDEEGLEEI